MKVEGGKRHATPFFVLRGFAIGLTLGQETTYLYCGRYPLARNMRWVILQLYAYAFVVTGQRGEFQSRRVENGRAIRFCVSLSTFKKSRKAACEIVRNLEYPYSVYLLLALEGLLRV